MSRRIGAVQFSDGHRLYLIFDGTVDVALRPLFDSPDAAWSWDGKQVDFPEPRDASTSEESIIVVRDHAYLDVPERRALFESTAEPPGMQGGSPALAAKARARPRATPRGGTNGVGTANGVEDAMERIRLWHGTTELFDTFNTSCALGAHFGTRAAAEARLHDVAREEGEVDVWEISFENALEIVDLGTWGFPSVLRELRSKGVLSAAQVDAAYEANNRSDTAGWAFVKDALRARVSSCWSLSRSGHAMMRPGHLCDAVARLERHNSSGLH